MSITYTELTRIRIICDRCGTAPSYDYEYCRTPDQIVKATLDAFLRSGFERASKPYTLICEGCRKNADCTSD